jgi:hypothetical protein
MRLPSRRACLVPAALLLLAGCASKEAKETRAAATLAVRELQGLVDEGIERGIKEREAARSEEPLDFAAIAATAIQRFMALPEARALKNPYDPGKPIYSARAEAREPGTVYLDGSTAPSGTLLVTAVFKEGASLRREPSSVKVNVLAKPPRIEVDSGGPPVAPRY